MIRPRFDIALVLAIALLAGCGGGTADERWSVDEVTSHLHDRLGVDIPIDTGAAGRRRAVLRHADERLGAFSIYVFEEGADAQGSEIGAVEVPPAGKIAWSEWERYGELLPNYGLRRLVKTYGENVVLEYTVEEISRFDAKNPELPGGYRLLDDALSSLPG